jgi:SAM-dependent methyltransferase
MLTTENKELRKWERVEIERSNAEAQHQDFADLKADETQIARYLNPPADTAYYLEYAYHLLGDVRGRRVLDFGCGNGENTFCWRGAARTFFRWIFRPNQSRSQKSDCK